MSEKITVNHLASLLAATAGVDEDVAMSFISALVMESAALLENGKSVKVKGLGEFNSDGTFSPDEALAEKVNAPFSFFEPVELAEGVTDEMLSEVAEPAPPHDSQPDPVPDSPCEAVADIQTDTESDMESEAVMVTTPDDETVAPPKPEPNAATEVNRELVADTEPAKYPKKEEEQPTDNHDGNTSSWLKLAISFIAGLAIGVGISYMLMPIPDGVKSTLESEKSLMRPVPINETDTEIAEPQAARISPTLTDTVRPGYYFTTMARKHYGNKAFWVYIYEANARHLDSIHPERIPAGTVVTIPAPSDYRIDGSDPESLKAAKAKAYEIYGRFN